MTPAEKIAKNLELYHDGKFGFAVYRVDYNDDEKWSEFKQRLAEYAAAGIIDDEHGDLICDQWTFDFMEDENRFTGASTNEIRRSVTIMVATRLITDQVFQTLLTVAQVDRRLSSSVHKISS